MTKTKQPTVEEHIALCQDCKQVYEDSRYKDAWDTYFIDEEHLIKYGALQEEFPSINEWHIAFK